MSSREQETIAFITRVATAYDGAVIGVAAAVFAARALQKYLSTSDALARIRAAPSATVADLRSLLSDDDGDGKLVVVRGQAQPNPAVSSSWLGRKHNRTLVAPKSGETGLVVQNMETCLYNSARGFFGWSFDLRTLLGKTWERQRFSSLKTVPFVLAEGGEWPNSEYVHIALGSSTHPLPLTLVYHRLRPVQYPSYSLFWAMFGYSYPVAILDEEKILPVGKDITAVGICSTRDGDLDIKSCKELPCFLSDMTKEEIEADLTLNANILFWSGVVLGSLSLGILGFAIIRKWQRWREVRKRRQIQESITEALPPGAASEELTDVPEGELCVICLMRQRVCAFVPCGHRVCCQGCAMSVQVRTFPTCPVCRQDVRSSIRIYNS